jgi:hypothetical protein
VTSWIGFERNVPAKTHLLEFVILGRVMNWLAWEFVGASVCELLISEGVADIRYFGIGRKVQNSRSCLVSRISYLRSSELEATAAGAGISSSPSLL